MTGLEPLSIARAANPEALHLPIDADPPASSQGKLLSSQRTIPGAILFAGRYSLQMQVNWRSARNTRGLAKSTYIFREWVSTSSQLKKNLDL